MVRKAAELRTQQAAERTPKQRKSQAESAVPKKEAAVKVADGHVADMEKKIAEMQDALVLRKEAAVKARADLMDANKELQEATEAFEAHAATEAASVPSAPAGLPNDAAKGLDKVFSITNRLVTDETVRKQLDQMGRDYAALLSATLSPPTTEVKIEQVDDGPSPQEKQDKLQQEVDKLQAELRAAKLDKEQADTAMRTEVAATTASPDDWDFEDCDLDNDAVSKACETAFGQEATSKLSGEDVSSFAKRMLHVLVDSAKSKKARLQQ